MNNYNNSKSNNNFLMIRMLGNDLDGIHGNEQTYINLKFTLMYEPNFLNTKKIYVLNRIVNTEKKNKIIELLNQYNTEYIDIPFDINKFNKIPKIKFNMSKFKTMGMSEKIKKLYYYNLYLVNNNGCRNFCLKYGKKNNYKWTFVLDSNSFFTKEAFQTIVNDINKTNAEYLIIPQKRLKDGNLTNDILLTSNYCEEIEKIKIQEPQIAFKNTSKIMFNSKIPYGNAPKAELLSALNVKGPWTQYINKTIRTKKFKWFYERKFKNIKTKKTSYVIRLTPFSKENCKGKNTKLRMYGVFLLVKKIFKEKRNKLKH